MRIIGVLTDCGRYTYTREHLSRSFVPREEGTAPRRAGGLFANSRHRAEKPVISRARDPLKNSMHPRYIRFPTRRISHESPPRIAVVVVASASAVASASQMGGVVLPFGAALPRASNFGRRNSSVTRFKVSMQFPNLAQIKKRRSRDYVIMDVRMDAGC